MNIIKMNKFPVSWKLNFTDLQKTATIYYSTTFGSY